jgi:hypothetical protein
MKLCKDCKYVKNPESNYTTCTNPKVAKINKTSGKINKVYTNIERMLIIGNCGHFAWHFEAKENENSSTI